MKIEGAQQLRALSLELKEADKVLLRQMRKRLRVATSGAAEAVVAHEKAVLPKRGGLNEWVAAAPVKVSILTGLRSATVALRQGRNQGATNATLAGMRADLREAKRASRSARADLIAKQISQGRGLGRSNLRLANQTGEVRHPNRSGPRFSIERRDEAGGWSNTPVPKEWWEAALAPYRTAAAVEMQRVMNDVARAAGFH